MADCKPTVITDGIAVQQTGPRTVIVPADPIIWSEDSNYEYLTLVASENFARGYVSKRDVPAGTPLTDTDYWIPVASFNAQLSDVQSEVADINGQITVIQTELAKKAYQTAVDDINGQITVIQTELAKKADQTAVDELSHERYLVILGDSFSVDDGTANSSEGPLWYEYVAKQYGLTAKPYAANGAGFLTGNENNFTVQLNKAKEELEAKYVAMVCVLGGWNDLRSGNTGTPLLTKVRELCTDITTAFPSARVIVAGCNTFRNGIVNNNESTRTVTLSIESGVRTAGGCAFVDVHLLNIMQDAFFGAHGGTHPNSYGEKAIASAFMSLTAPQATNLGTQLNFPTTNGTVQSSWLYLNNNSTAYLYLYVKCTEDGDVKITLPTGIDMVCNTTIAVNTVYNETNYDLLYALVSGWDGNNKSLTIKHAKENGLYGISLTFIL